MVCIYSNSSWYSLHVYHTAGNCAKHLCGHLLIRKLHREALASAHHSRVSLQHGDGAACSRIFHLYKTSICYSRFYNTPQVIQMIHKAVFCSFYFWGDRSHSVAYAGLELVAILLPQSS